MSGIPYQPKRVYIGQYKIVAMRIAPNQWTTLVFDMDKPDPGGCCLYRTGIGFFKTSADAIADGQKKMHRLGELAAWRGRLNVRLRSDKRLPSFTFSLSTVEPFVVQMQVYEIDCV